MKGTKNQKSRNKVQQPPQRRKQQKPRVVNITAGAPVVGKETLLAAKVAANATSVAYIKTFTLTDASPILKKYATIYDSYKIKSVAYRFVTDEASTKSGNVSLGIDYGKAPSSLSRDSVCKLTPHYTGPIKKNTPWVEVSNRFFNPNLVRYVSDTDTDTAPFSLCLLLSCEASAAERTLGALEIKYSLEMLGIQP
ncbi:MAG: coat protein [Sanya permutotetravirus 3]|nr:MAG: coat protein [Sanya permutotetravirus 3]